MHKRQDEHLNIYLQDISSFHKQTKKKTTVRMQSDQVSSSNCNFLQNPNMGNSPSNWNTDYQYWSPLHIPYILLPSKKKNLF
jgi:hypothetical protein